MYVKGKCQAPLFLGPSLSYAVWFWRRRSISRPRAAGLRAGLLQAGLLRAGLRAGLPRQPRPPRIPDRPFGRRDSLFSRLLWRFRPQPPTLPRLQRESQLHPLRHTQCPWISISPRRALRGVTCLTMDLTTVVTRMRATLQCS